MLLSILLILFLLAVAEPKKKKTNLGGVGISLLGTQVPVGKAYSNFTLSTGQYQLFYAVLGKQDALDLHRIHCVITNAKELTNEGLYFLQITASNGRGSVSFSIPETTSKGSLLYESARIVHPLLVTDFEGPHNQVLIATVQSRSFRNVSVSIRFTNYDRAQYDVKLPSGTPTRFLHNQRAGYVRPLSYRVSTAGADAVRILIESGDNLCARLIVTKGEGSLYARDIEHGKGNDGILREMEFTRRLDLVLYKADVPQHMLMFVFVYSEDDRCEPGAPARIPTKLKLLNITWTAEEEVSILKSISVSIALYLVPIVAALVYAVMVDDLRRNRRNLHTITNEQPMELYLKCLNPPSEIANTDDAVADNTTISEDVLDAKRATENATVEFLEGKTVVLGDVNPRSNTRIGSRAISTSCENEEWSWSSAQSALVLLPILSLVIAMPYYGPSWSDDNCFHNYACSKSFSIFTSFNHIFSNVGYVLCSVAFLVFAKIRKEKLTRDHGAYNNYGLEICMGLSLLCQAGASTIYHLCPNSITYNLDTPFIEVLCILVILKLFGNRRETVKAQTANMATVLVIFVDSIITMFAKKSLTRLFVIISLPFLVLLAIAKFFRPSLSAGRRGIATKRPLFASLIAIIVNILMAITFILPADRIQSNQIVTVICLTNTFLYFLYYVFMKWCFGEQLCQFSRMCSAAAIILWIPALYFFLIDETDWALTPAQSRAHNRPCVLLSLFDYHDLWHMTSSLASLVTLMAVSTMDDAVSALPRGALAVF